MEADIFAAVNRVGFVFEIVDLDDALQELGDIALEMVEKVPDFVLRNGEMTGTRNHSSLDRSDKTMLHQSPEISVPDLTYMTGPRLGEGFEMEASEPDNLDCRGHESKEFLSVPWVSAGSPGSLAAFVACILGSAERVDQE